MSKVSKEVKEELDSCMIREEESSKKEKGACRNRGANQWLQRDSNREAHLSRTAVLNAMQPTAELQVLFFLEGFWGYLFTKCATPALTPARSTHKFHFTWTL